MTQDNSNIIAIASGKGGVGKTWFAITLAHILARSGRRVLLFDGDIGLANVDVQLGLTTTRDVSSVFSGKHTLNDTITHYAAGKFDIIAGRSGSTSLASIPVDRLQTVGEELTSLAASYDHVLIDLGAGIESNVQYLSSLAKQALIVINDEPTSLTDSYAFIKLCISRAHAPKINVIVNNAASQKEGDKTFEALNRACTTFLNFSPQCLGVVRRDNKVRDAIRAQQSIVTLTPGTTAASDVATISLRLLKQQDD